MTEDEMCWLSVRALMTLLSTFSGATRIAGNISFPRPTILMYGIPPLPSCVSCLQCWTLVNNAARRVLLV